MFTIIQAESYEHTKLVCPHCHEKVPRIGVRKGGKIEGLVFKCRRCSLFWEVKAE